MKFLVHPELPTALVGSSQATTAAVDNSAPFVNRLESTNKSGFVVQTNGATSNYLFWTRHVQSKAKQAFVPVSPRMLYELAKRYDEWPGVDYDGSSCRGALKGWHKHGVCSFVAWPYKLDRGGDPIFVRPSQSWQLELQI